MKQPVKIFIADDHQMFIDGIKALLQHEKDIEMVGEATSGTEVLIQLEKLGPDIILMDIGMSGLNGIETTNTITDKHPSIKVIALTMYDDSIRISKMQKAGAKGYLLKNTSKNELLEAIQVIAEGGNYYSKNLIKTKSTGALSNNPLADITEREIEVIKLIAKGMTNKEIANQLSISELTVNTHRKNAMRKLEIKNTAALVKFALENNLPDL